MDKIQVFLDNVFASLPKTIEVSNRKDELYADMSRNYQKYLNEGKSEAESFGLVVQNFGSIEEIRYELKLDDHDIYDMYPTAHSNSGILALGACLMLAGVLGCGLLYSLFLDDWICLLVFFIGVVSGTLLLFWQSLKNTQQYGHDTMTLIVFAASLLAAGIFGTLVLSEMWVDGLVVMGYFLIYVGAGIVLIIYLLAKRAVRNGRNLTIRKSTKKLESIVYPVVTLIYLCIGFFFGGWHPWWLLYVAAAVFMQIYNQNR